LDTLAECYGAKLGILDFIGSPEKSRSVINQWVIDKTEGKIKNLLPPGSIDSLTRLILVNAIYFKSKWLKQFSKSNTQDDDFHTIDGDTITVPMMSQEDHFRHTKGDGYQAIELPYLGSMMSMVIFVPDSGKFKELEARLDAELVQDTVQNLRLKEVELSMPKYEFEAGFRLKPVLSKMGMPTAFNFGEANFSGITTSMLLFIGDVYHKAFVLVDEEGTEAAAATAVEMRPGRPTTYGHVKLKIDRPFIFLIRDVYGSIFFMGRVMNPLGTQ
jgi:serpin B